MRISVSKRVARVGVAATAVGLAAGGYGIAWAVSGPTAQAQPAGSDAAALAANNQAGPSAVPGNPPGPAGRWGARHMMARGAGGTLTAVGPASITVSGPDGQSRTINTDSSTTYSRDGAAASRSALAVGERVRVRLVRPSDGSGSSGSQATTSTAAHVDIADPRLAGTVQSVQGSVITLADGEGFWRTIQTDGSTKFMDGTSSSTLSAIKAGDRVAAFGTVASDHTTLDAIEVRILHPGTAPSGSPVGPGMMGRGPGMMGGGFGPGDDDGPGGPPPGGANSGSTPSGGAAGASA